MAIILPRNKGLLLSLDADSGTFSASGAWYALAGDDALTYSTSASMLLGSGDDWSGPIAIETAGVNSSHGGEGNDTIVGGGSDEWSNGSYMTGGSGNDSLLGGASKDTLLGDGFDFRLSYLRNDLMFPVIAPGDDTIRAGAGADTLIGGLGADWLWGDEGEDLMIGGPGADQMWGGAGRDLFIWESAEDFGDTISDFEAGADGDRLFLPDLIRTTPGTSQSSYLRLEQVEEVVGSSIRYDTLVWLDRDGPASGLGWEQVARLVGVLAGSIDPTQFVALTPDWLHVSPVTGGSLRAYASEWGDAIVLSWDDPDGIDLYVNPMLYTLGGDDDVVSDIGGAVVLGDGDDSFTAVRHPVLSQFSPPQADGGPGSDTLLGSHEGDVLVGGSGDDSLEGNEGQDVLLGDFEDLTAFGPRTQPAPALVSGDDTIRGGAGDDLILGGSGADLLDGGAGADLFAWLDPDEFGDTIEGFEYGADGDLLFFGNLIVGTDGASAFDYLTLEQFGDDVRLWLDPDAWGALPRQLVATLEDVGVQALHPDQLPGFSPTSASLTEPKPGNPIIVEQLSQSSPSYAMGTYWADDWTLEAAAGLLTMYLLLDGDDRVVSARTGTFLLGAGDDDFAGSAAVGYNVRGDGGSDTLIAGPATAVLFDGAAGDDWLQGGAGNDQLHGDWYESELAIGRQRLQASSVQLEDGGIDSIFGGAGDDLIVGGPGADDLTGGTGADLFVYEGWSHLGDAIRDFNPAEGDRILLNFVARLHPGALTASDYVSSLAVGGGSELWIDLDADGDAFAPELLAALPGTPGNAIDVDQVVLLAEEYSGLFNEAPTGLVSVTGTPVAGQLLTASSLLVDSNGIGTISYQWQSSADGLQWTAIPNATQETLAVDAGLAGLQIRVTASYRDGDGNPEAVASAATAPVITPNIISGTDGPDNLIDDSPLGSLILGLPGDDTMTGGAGDDTLDGGAGIDTAVYGLARAQASISGQSVQAPLAAIVAAGALGTDTLAAVERLAFTDRHVALDILPHGDIDDPISKGEGGNGGKAYRLYQAAFDRTPDLSGLGYWILQVDQGESLFNIATGFLGSAEFQALYGVNPSNEEYTQALYLNVLDREPDAFGYAYWNAVLSNEPMPVNPDFGELSGAYVGQTTRQQMLVDFSESAENKDNLAEIIGVGFDYLPWLV